MDLNGGVVVVETGRIFGGDSGYFYIGSIEPSGTGLWNATVTINRHDPNIVSYFGDIDSIELSGTLRRQENDASNRPVIYLEMRPDDHALAMTAQMTRVADLP